MNQGVRASTGSEVVILNNDTVVTSGWLERMLSALRTISACGLVRPCSNCVPGRQKVEPGYSDLAGLESFASHHAQAHPRCYYDAAVLGGFCLLLDRKLIEKIGGFEEEFGIGTFDDYDFCCRAIDAGYRAVICRDVFVHHFGSVTLNACCVDVTALLRRNQQVFDRRQRSRAFARSVRAGSVAEVKRSRSDNSDDAIHKVYIGDSLIGDALFTEPALRARAMRDARSIPLLLRGPPRQLFERNPYVTLIPQHSEPEIIDQTWITLRPIIASRIAIAQRRHICAGFFEQLGLAPDYFDHRPRIYGDGLEDDKRPPIGHRNGRIALAPFSASCSVHTSGVRNKTIDLAWWEELVSVLPLPADSFGALEEPCLKGCRNIRGRPLREVALMLQQCEVYVGGDTGLTAMAGALGCDIIILSAAYPVWLTGPQTNGKLEVVSSPTPPNWRHSEVVRSVQRILGDG